MDDGPLRTTLEPRTLHPHGGTLLSSEDRNLGSSGGVLRYPTSGLGGSYPDRGTRRDSGPVGLGHVGEDSHRDPPGPESVCRGGGGNQSPSTSPHPPWGPQRPRVPVGVRSDLPDHGPACLVHRGLRGDQVRRARVPEARQAQGPRQEGPGGEPGVLGPKSRLTLSLSLVCPLQYGPLRSVSAPREMTEGGNLCSVPGCLLSVAGGAREAGLVRVTLVLRLEVTGGDSPPEPWRKEGKGGGTRRGGWQGRETTAGDQS